MRVPLGTHLFFILFNCQTIFGSEPRDPTPAVGQSVPQPFQTERYVPRFTNLPRYVKSRNKSRGYNGLLNLRAITTSATCGFVDGDPTKPRTADEGYDCRVEVLEGLWGFCSSNIIAATDCGLVGACEDGSSCAGDCGDSESILGVTTITWYVSTCSAMQSLMMIDFGYR
jgi:hypothetical protein